MTALPQLVAAFHSLVGLAAVFVAAAALYSPQSFGIGIPARSQSSSLIEMSLGVAIGAIHLTGSIIACAKLQALMTGAPLVFPYQHHINAGLGVLIVVLIVALRPDRQARSCSGSLSLLSLALGLLLIVPIGGADMPVVISMLNSYSGWAACGIGFTLQNSLLIVTGALVGSSARSELRDVPRHEPLDLQRHPRRLRHRGRHGRGDGAPRSRSRSSRAAPRMQRSS